MIRIFRIFLLLGVASTTFAQTSQSAPADASQPAPRKVDKAAAYYHYTLAHMYEEMVTAYGRSDLALKATEEYRLAIEADPSSSRDRDTTAFFHLANTRTTRRPSRA